MIPDVTTKSHARFIAHFLSLILPVPPPDQLETISRGEWSSMGTATYPKWSHLSEAVRPMRSGQTYPKLSDSGQRPIQIDDQI